MQMKLLYFCLLISISVGTIKTFAQQQHYTIQSIKIGGNKRTKDKIIYREFIKKIGDTVQADRLNYIVNRSQQNIFNTQLFVFDTVYIEKKDSNKISLRAHVRERWYLWPIPIFEIQDRNFNTWWQTKDLFRINYGMTIDHRNFTGNKDILSVVVQKGYYEKYGIVYRLPYLNAKQTSGIRTSFFYKQAREVPYTTIGNEPIYYRDYHNFVFNVWEAKTSFLYRKRFFDLTNLELVYSYINLADTLLKLNPDFADKKKNELNYFTLFYSFTYDNTDIKPYPLKGWFFNINAQKNGLSILPQENANNFFAFSTLKKYTPLNTYFNLANSISCKYKDNSYLPYFFNRSLGYGSSVRGYEYYIIDGQRYFLTKNAFKVRLLKPRTYFVKPIKNISQFNTIPFYAYLNVFFDAAYVEDKFYYQKNYLANKWLYGYGVGLDLISYYDFVFRIECSMNNLNQYGVFLHLGAGI